MTGYTDPPAGSGVTQLVPDAFEAAVRGTVQDPEDATVSLVVPETTDDDWETVVHILERETLLTAQNIDLLVGPSVEALATAFERESAFLHCGVPLTDAGFACTDGWLDPETIDGSGARAVFTHGPASVRAAQTLTRSGTITAIAASADPGPTTVARLLRGILRGHDVAFAARFAALGDAVSFRLVGAPTRQVVQRVGGTTAIDVAIRSVTADEHRVSVRFHPNEVAGMGSLCRLHEPFVREEMTLVGTAAEQPLPCDTPRIVDVLEDDEYLVRLNDEPYYGEREPTETFVRESAVMETERESSH